MPAGVRAELASVWVGLPDGVAHVDCVIHYLSLVLPQKRAPTKRFEQVGNIESNTMNKLEVVIQMQL